jgi:hypothetical protein
MGLSEGVYSGDKWGGKYLRAPDVYRRIFGDSSAHFTSLDKMAVVYGYIHDNSTGTGWPKMPVLWSVKDASSIMNSPSSPGIRSIGVNPKGNSTDIVPILFPRTFGSRHLVVMATDGLLGKEFYKIMPRRAEDTESILVQLNSTLGMLQREILGIRGLGGGAIKFAARDVGLFMILPDFDTKLCCRAIKTMLQRKIRDFEDELCMDDRREIDGVIFDQLGLYQSQRDEVYSAVQSLIESRSEKSKHVTA